MIAVILAAGRGRRMRPMTDATHKALIEIGGRPILGRLLDQLADLGVADVILVTGYRADEVEAYVTRAHPATRFVFVRNERWAETNNVCSLALALDRLGAVLHDDVLLAEADVVTAPGVLARLVRSAHANVALVDRWRAGMTGTVVALAGDVIADVFPAARQTPSFDLSDKWKTLNLYRFAGSFCAGPFKQLVRHWADAVDASSFYEVVLGVLVAMKGEPIHAERLDGEAWAELDDPNDLDAARFLFEAEGRAGRLAKTHGAYWSYEVRDHAYLANAHFPPGAMLAQLRTALPALAASYGSSQENLAKKLGYLLPCAPERLRVLNGASEAYPSLARHFAGRRVLLPSPTFGEYGRAFPGARTYPDAPGEAPGIDTTKLSAMSEDADAVVFVSPNNPTGTTLPSAWLHAFAAARPSTSVVVDESFVDFSDERSLIDLLEEQPLANVIVLKSLSKCWGVPGLRLGFSYSTDAAWNARLGAELPIWNVNSVAEHVLEIVGQHREALSASFARTKADRAALRARLVGSPAIAEVHEGGGNFLLVRLRGDAAFAAGLARSLVTEHGVWVKDVSDKLGARDGWLRLGLRTPEENAALADRLDEARP